MEKFRVASLFSGIGGFEKGLEESLANFEVVFASEIDTNAVRSYSANYSTKYLVGDIKEVDENSIPNHNLLCAGFPCQSFSIAGKQKGFEDIRGTLFFDVIRILKAKKPKYVFLENVKNLISHDKGETIKVILKNISDCGYSFDFTIINSCESGVPQNRERFYLIGILDYKSEPFELDKRNLNVNKIKSWANSENLKTFNFFNNLTFENKRLIIKDILDEEVNQKYYLNSKSIEKYLNETKIELNHNNEYKIVKLFTLPRDVHNDLDRQRRVYSIYGISPTLLARSDATKILVEENSSYRIRKITPYEAFRVQGFDMKYVLNLKKAEMADGCLYKQAGNAVSPPVIAGIINELIRIENNV